MFDITVERVSIFDETEEKKAGFIFDKIGIFLGSNYPGTRVSLILFGGIGTDVTKNALPPYSGGPGTVLAAIFRRAVPSNTNAGILP